MFFVLLKIVNNLTQTHADLLLGCRDDNLGVFVYVAFMSLQYIKKKGETQAHAHAPPKGYITFLATARTINHLITNTYKNIFNISISSILV